MVPRYDLCALRGLYAIVDPEACRGRDPVAVAREILSGGCAVLQVRAKRLAPEPLAALSRTLRALCAEAGVPFHVNDFPVLAREVGADGVHLGQRDATIAEARAVVGEALTIGVSTHNLAQALAAERVGADLIGFGPVFPTRSKDNPDPVVGVARLAEVCRRVTLPVVAIGGVDSANVASVAQAGTRLAAAIGAVCGADDPAAAARTFHRAMRGEPG